MVLAQATDSGGLHEHVSERDFFEIDHRQPLFGGQLALTHLEAISLHGSRTGFLVKGAWYQEERHCPFVPWSQWKSLILSTWTSSFLYHLFSMPLRRKSRPKKVQRSKEIRVLTREEKDAKAQYEQLRRRSWSLVRKSKELKDKCQQVKVFTLVVDQARNRGHLFSSARLSDTWPPSGLDLVSFMKVSAKLLSLISDQTQDGSLRQIIETDRSDHRSGLEETNRRILRRSARKTEYTHTVDAGHFKSLCASFQNMGNRKYALLQLLSDCFKK